MQYSRMALFSFPTMADSVRYQSPVKRCGGLFETTVDVIIVVVLYSTLVPCEVSPSTSGKARFAIQNESTTYEAPIVTELKITGYVAARLVRGVFRGIWYRLS